jgi:dTDP-4-amino-4,6-dideoxygalactose transaminase
MADGRYGKKSAKGVRVIVPFNDLTRIHEPLRRQFLDSLDQHLNESQFVQGRAIKRFEIELAKSEGVSHAVAVNSGTSALILAFRALNIGPGDEVITTNFTFIATVFAILEVGALPVLVDCNEGDLLMNIEQTEQAITSKTKAIAFVSLHGRVEGLDKFRDLANAYNLKLILDASQSHLGLVHGNPQSSYADITTLSFYPGKNLGALGEGGALLTSDDNLDESFRLMRDWGSTQKYEHGSWGGNFRLHEIQASFLSIKLENLGAWTVDRREIASQYFDVLPSEMLLNRPINPESHVFHIFAIKHTAREQLQVHFQESGISYGFHYPKTVHQQNYYYNKVKLVSSLINSEKLANEIISIPLFPLMHKDEIDYVITKVQEFKA